MLVNSADLVHLNQFLLFRHRTRVWSVVEWPVWNMTAHKPNILPKLTREVFVSETAQMK